MQKTIFRSIYHLYGERSTKRFLTKNVKNREKNRELLLGFDFLLRFDRILSFGPENKSNSHAIMILPHLPPLCSPRRTGAAELYLLAPLWQPTWAASIRPIRLTESNHYSDRKWWKYSTLFNICQGEIDCAHKYIQQRVYFCQYYHSKYNKSFNLQNSCKSSNYVIAQIFTITHRAFCFKQKHDYMYTQKNPFFFCEWHKYKIFFCMRI